MNKIIIALSTMLLLFSCMPETQNKQLTYQNIVILSDMSSRIRNSRFPNKDNQEIHKIIEYFKSECVKPGEKIGDKSSLTFSSFSEKNAITIDLGDFKDLGDKQSFINSTNKFKNSGLVNELKAFEDTVKSLYSRISNTGLDLISILSEKIDNENIVKQCQVITDGIDTTFINYENHIHIFTDGYLEYVKPEKQQNNQFYFGDEEIDRVRKYCLANNIDVSTALKKNKSLCLPAIENNKNKFLHLHILETHERDKDIKFQRYKYKKGYRDNEILEVVWRNWAEESGFKSFEWKKY
jgi:hypothetical protein